MTFSPAPNLCPVDEKVAEAEIMNEAERRSPVRSIFGSVKRVAGRCRVRVLGSPC